MANRIVGNVLIIDSGMGNAIVLGSGGFLGNISTLTVNAIGFYSTDTTGLMILTDLNTATNEVFRTGWVAQGAGTSISPAMQWFGFNVPQRFTNLKVPTLTLGTGFLYLA